VQTKNANLTKISILVKRLLFPITCMMLV